MLEVGSGSGYQTAVLAEVAGEVYAVELLAPLAERARARSPASATPTCTSPSATAPAAGASRRRSTASSWRPPPTRRRRALLEQLADGGRLVIPLGRRRGDQVLTVFERPGDAFEERHDTRCRFVPLVRDASPDERREAALRGARRTPTPAARLGGEDARGDSRYPEEEAA